MNEVDINKPLSIIQILIALVLLIIEIGFTSLLGLFAVMSAPSYLGWLLMIVLPTALIPVVYLLTVHALFARSSHHAYDGIVAAITVFLANGIVEAIWLYLVSIIPAMNNLMHWSNYILVIILIILQTTLLLYFRKRLIECYIY